MVITGSVPEDTHCAKYNLVWWIYGESRYPLFRGDRHCCGHRANLLFPSPSQFYASFRETISGLPISDGSLCLARRDIVKPADSAILYSSTRFLHACTRRRVEITSREGSSEQNKVRSYVYSSPTSVADEIRTVFHSAQARTHRRGGGEPTRWNRRNWQTHAPNTRNRFETARRAIPNKWARRNILTYALRIGGS